MSVMTIVWPIFERVVSKITKAGQERNPMDIWVIMQSTMAEVAITIFLGQVSVVTCTLPLPGAAS